MSFSSSSSSVSYNMAMSKPRRKTFSLLKLTLTTFFFFFFLSVLATTASTAAAAATDAFVYGGCSQQKYSPGSPYETNLNSLLTSLVNSATYSSYNNFTVMGSSAADTARGLFQCRGDLSMPDCATCVARAVSQVGSLCPSACGGALQLSGCYIKYDNVSFLGAEDKTVVLKKCGPSEGYNTEEIGERDAVLTGLLSGGGGGGYFRVGGSGEVRGMAQCVGDLTAAECQDCFTTAIGRLKSDCGTAVSGDMFLAKCYAIYSTAAAHSYSNPHKYKTSYEGEKTFAIIIGLLAAVVLLIIFLLFLRRICGRNGK